VCPSFGVVAQENPEFQNDTEVDLLTDYMVYAFRPNGFNMAEKISALEQKDF